MYPGRNNRDPNVPWSVRAELTVQRGAQPQETPESTSGVRMTYSFSTRAPSAPPAAMAPYAFQRGNLRFTSTPPQRSMIPVRTTDDSGYASTQSSDKRCTSTYSIVLAGNTAPASRLPFPRPWSTYRQQQQQQQVPAAPQEGARGKVATAVATTDVASQTTDIEDAKLSPVASRKKVTRNTCIGTPAGSIVQNEPKDNHFDRVSRTPTTSSTKSPTPTVSDSSSSDKRKRTVHIDVYCTGTEDEDEDTELSASSAGEEGDRTQSTVFESTDVRVTHTQAKPGALPRGFQDDKAFLRRCESFRNVPPMRMPSLTSTKGGYESDDVLSSLYPSQFSSYSRIRDFESSLHSSRSGLALDEYEESTSWKDTDVDSLVPSKASVTTSDSFEYADSLDRERIRRLDPAWRRKKKNPEPWSSESSESLSGSEDDEVAWSFVSSEENTSIVQGKLTLPSVVGTAPVITATNAPLASPASPSSLSDQDTEQLIKEVKKSIFRDRIGPFGSVSPTPPPSKIQSRMTSPFTTPQGERTDHIIKASIFGRVVSTFRKPGHHVGPAKNPSCSCEHCRRHFEELARVRIDSVAERRTSSGSVTNSS